MRQVAGAMSESELSVMLRKRRSSFARHRSRTVRDRGDKQSDAPPRLGPALASDDLLKPPRALILVSLALLGFRLLSAVFAVTQPGYTDAFYYVDVARRIAAGDGLSADFVWNFIEAPKFEPLPVPSHRFWMPLASTVQALGIVLFEPILGTFRAAQAPVIAIAAFVPAAAYGAARSLGGSAKAALAAAGLTGLGGGFFAPAWVTLDSFGTAALLGTFFFILVTRVAAGELRAGVLAGLTVGILYLARAEAALFGTALLALTLTRNGRRAGLIGSGVALAIGLVWVARGLALGGTPDLLVRTSLLSRYEDFFGTATPVIGDPSTLLAQRLSAVASEATVVLLALMGFLIFPLAIAIRARWRYTSVRVFCGLALLIYLAAALVWPLHAARGSYVHSLAAFYPFAMALSAVGGESWLARRRPTVARVTVVIALVGAFALSLLGIYQWSESFNELARRRVSALALIPPGPFMAIDAAAWRWIAGRSVLVTPADGPERVACIARAYGAKSLVLEPAHFSAYDDVFRGGQVVSLGPAQERDGIRVYPLLEGGGC